MKNSDLLKVLEKLATDKSLKGADIRIALLLAGTLKTPADLIQATGMSKSSVSHSLRNLMDSGYLFLHVDQRQRWYGLKDQV